MRTGTRGQTERTPDPTLAPVAYWCLGVGFLVAAVQATGLLGSLADASFALLSVGCLVALAVGLRHHRPASPWTWKVLGAAIALFLVGAVARDSLGTLGDLSGDRSVVPDVITLSGYLLLSLSFAGMIRARYRHRTDRVDALLDAAVAAFSTLCVAWVYLIIPTLSADSAPTSVRLVLACYPMMSAFLVAITARLAFSAGERSGLSFRLLLAAMLLLLLGDVAFMLAELGIVDVGRHLLGLPYALVQVTTAAAVLHPSMREMTTPLPAIDPGLARSRVVVVAAALAIPGVVTVTHPSLTPVERLCLAVIVAGLTAAAVARMVRALHAHADARVHLAHRATHDELTGLPNRSFLRAFLGASIERSHGAGLHVALLFLDLDRFKYVNDSLGHVVGDQLLVRVAARLRNTVRPDDLVVRLGGDEFVIVLPDVCGLDEALELAERVRLSFMAPLTVGPSSIVSSTSIGVVVSGSPDHDQDDLLRDADTAMYQAKDAGRNTIAVFDQSMLDRAARRMLLDAELRGAIATRQLHVEYQPLVVLPSGQVEGFEALMRWTHPTIGVISPAEFIPVAEDNGLIVDLGAWILDESCRQLALWRASVAGGQSLHVSVNVSARQLRAGGFPATVAAVLARWGLPGESLWLELTESLLLDDPATTGGCLEALRALGVKLSVDDFGTGYSSLAYLKRFPVDRVKIDAAFVSGVGVGGSDDSLIAAIVAMCDALGLSTIAEGVETADQARDLYELRVGAAQGYHFARPLPAHKVVATLSHLGIAGAGARPATTPGATAVAGADRADDDAEVIIL